MQKKLIALAVGALVSGAAFAQSNISVYGTIDMGYTNLGRNKVDSGLDKGKTTHAINSGQSSTSRLGFSGAEELGLGTKAIFTLEAGYLADDGTHANTIGGGNRLFTEQAFVGLTGGWGTAIAGRLVAPRYAFLSALDPFADGTVGRFGNVYEDIVDPYATAPIANIDRVDNTIAYVSPSLGGFNVTAAYATNGLETEGIGNDGDARVATLLPRYANGPLDVGLAWQQVSFKNAYPLTGESLKLKQWTLGGSYDLGVVKLSLAYDDFRTSGLKRPLGQEQDLKSWLIGLSVPFGRNAIQLSYNQSKAKKEGLGADGKARQVALGYTYSLSKRTNVYAAYAALKNDKSNGGYTRTVNLADASNNLSIAPALGYYSSGLQLGLKHSF